MLPHITGKVMYVKTVELTKKDCNILCKDDSGLTVMDNSHLGHGLCILVDVNQANMSKTAMGFSKKFQGIITEAVAGCCGLILLSPN